MCSWRGAGRGVGIGWSGRRGSRLLTERVGQTGLTSRRVFGEPQPKACASMTSRTQHRRRGARRPYQSGGQFQTSNANDAQGVAAFFRDNQKAIASALDRAVRHGSTLGMRAFNVAFAGASRPHSAGLLPSLPLRRLRAPRAVFPRRRNPLVIVWFCRLHGGRRISQSGGGVKMPRPGEGRGQGAMTNLPFRMRRG